MRLDKTLKIIYSKFGKKRMEVTQIFGKFKVGGVKTLPGCATAGDKLKSCPSAYMDMVIFDCKSLP